MKNVDGSFVHVNMPSFVSLIVDKSSDQHLVVLVHGHKGSEFDMRIYKNYIAKIFPHSRFMITKVNRKEDNQSIFKMGEKLS